VKVTDSLSVVVARRARENCRARSDFELRNRIGNSTDCLGESLGDVVGSFVDGDSDFQFHCVPFLEHTLSIQQFGDTRNLSLLCAFDLWPRSHLSDEPLDIETGDNE
jgi:hypothetical protein